MSSYNRYIAPLLIELDLSKIKPGISRIGVFRATSRLNEVWKDMGRCYFQAILRGLANDKYISRVQANEHSRCMPTSLMFHKDILASMLWLYANEGGKLEYNLDDIKPAKIVDVGAGYGVFSVGMRRLGFTNIVSIDSNSLPVEVATDYLRVENAYCADLTNPDTYPAAISDGGIHYVVSKFGPTDLLPDMMVHLGPLMVNGGALIYKPDKLEEYAVLHDDISARLMESEFQEVVPQDSSGRNLFDGVFSFQKRS